MTNKTGTAQAMVIRGLVRSCSEARRLIISGYVWINDTQETDVLSEVADDDRIDVCPKHIKERYTEGELRDWAQHGLSSMSKQKLVNLCMLLGDYKEYHDWAKIGKEEHKMHRMSKETATEFEYRSV